MTDVTHYQPEPNDDDGFNGSLHTSFRTAGRLSFKAATKWTDQHDRSLSGAQMLVIGVDEQLRRWQDGKLEIIDSKPLPNVDALNASIPKNEWEPGLNGEPRPPYAYTVVIRLVDPNNGNFFEFANSTYGAQLAYDHLKEATIVMRSLRGERVTPLVVLSELPMKTKRFGIVMRPHFEIVGWKLPGGGGGDSLPSKSPTPQLPGSNSAPAPASQPASATGKPTIELGGNDTLRAVGDVKPATSEEILNDKIPF